LFGRGPVSKNKLDHLKLIISNSQKNPGSGTFKSLYSGPPTTNPMLILDEELWQGGTNSTKTEHMDRDGPKTKHYWIMVLHINNLNFSIFFYLLQFLSLKVRSFGFELFYIRVFQQKLCET